LNSLTSKRGQRSYDRAITDFVDWCCSEPRLAFNRTVVLRYRIYLEQRLHASTTINLRLAAVRRVAHEAADSGLLSLLGLHTESIQIREEHWVIADLLGKAGHIRTVAIPRWVKEAIDAWKEASRIAEGALFRSINKAGRVWGNGMTPKVLWEVVREAVSRTGIVRL
jgi:hypothetical protein